jgi:hypothetical protein
MGQVRGNERMTADRLLVDGKPEGVRVELAFKDHAYATWAKRYGGQVPPWIKKDWKQLADAKKAIGDDDLARRTWDAYLRCAEPFFAGHPVGKFLADLARWTTSARPPERRTQAGGLTERELAYREISDAVARDGAVLGEAAKRAEISRRFRERFPS